MHMGIDIVALVFTMNSESTSRTTALAYKLRTEIKNQASLDILRRTIADGAPVNYIYRVSILFHFIVNGNCSYCCVNKSINNTM